MNQIMIDLETMDTRPSAAIVAIGAVAFCPVTQQVDENLRYYTTVDLNSCLEAGLTVDGDTVMWWLKQDDAARSALTAGHSSSLTTALVGLSSWLKFYDEMAGPNDGKHHLDIWGNGADFDNVILENAYRAVGLDQPWGTFNNRCYRTLKKLFPDIQLERTGTHHNAADDAISQAHHIIRIMQRLKEAA